MNAEIVSIGTELLLGEIPDTNAAHIARQLFASGANCRRTTVVSDELDSVANVLRGALERAELVIVTGGLGPTQDDVTREALAAATGRALIFCDDLEPNLKRQGMTIDGADVIENLCGTAPGIALEHNGTLIFVLPGVPFEMKEMLAASVLPRIRARLAGVREVTRVKRLQVIGLPEAEIDARLGSLMDPEANPRFGTRVSGGVCAVRMIARGASEQDAVALLARAEKSARQALGRHVFGEDDDRIQNAVVRLCEQRGLTLAVAESCTGGLICGALTDVPGCSRVLKEGFVVYSNEAKVRELGVDEQALARYGAVSTEVAAQMAAGARRVAQADLALAVTGIAGPDGGTAEKPVGLVCFGLCVSRDGDLSTRTDSRVFRGDRATVRERATTFALGLFREAIMEKEV